MRNAIYNEFDPFAARWLRGLIVAGHIAAGAVDERSISDLRPADVTGAGQRHFFAGIGGWSAALRLAGVHDDADIWTGSCPCQPFSDAGRKRGTTDDRHLWPTWFGLIRECRPAVVLGEQVASRAGLGWLDAIFADLEGAGYACAAADLPAAGVGAPHKRQRLFFVAYANGEQWGLHPSERQPGRAGAEAERSREASRVAYRERAGLEIVGEQQARRELEDAERGGEARGGDLCDCGHGPDSHDFGDGDCNDCSCTYFMADAASGGRREGLDSAQVGADGGPGSAHSGWSNCDWIPCSDGVSRPVEPGTHPLVDGLPGRVGLLRGYGNAIVPAIAAKFIRAALSTLESSP